MTPESSAAETAPAASLAESIRLWVAALPPYSFFRLEDVPAASRSETATALSRLASRGELVERVAQGFYVRLGDLPFWNYPAAAVAYGGPGAGYANGTALRKFGWAWQAPGKAQIAVLGRAPRVSIRGCRFVARTNQARRSLNWAEVSLLEAIRAGRFLEFQWDEVVDRFRRRTALRAFGFPISVRPDALAYAGAREPRQRPEFYDRVQEVAEVMAHAAKG